MSCIEKKRFPFFLKQSVRPGLAAVALLLLLVPFQVRSQRIVSVDGTISEILYELGLADKLVGVDVTSTYPASMTRIKQVGHNRNISAEGILSLNPDLILVNEKSMLRPGLIQQLEKTGKKVVVFEMEYSPEGTRKLVRDIGAYFDKRTEAEQLVKRVDNDLRKLPKKGAGKKVLFIYARGAGTLMVSGQGTAVDQMIRLSGNTNAVQGFTDYKPLTSEALLAANPDYLLLFDSGLESVGGVDGLLKLPGIAFTKAGKNRNVIAMDGLYLMGFGPRIGAALGELASKTR